MATEMAHVHKRNAFEVLKALRNTMAIELRPSFAPEEVVPETKLRVSI
jgi:hypothetical protein